MESELIIYSKSFVIYLFAFYRSLQMIVDMSIKRYYSKIYSKWNLKDVTWILCKTTWDINHYVAYK
jgi:hypothetical protein